MSNRTVMLALGYAGLLPFFAFCAGAWWLNDWPAALSRQGFVIYSLGILSFLGGSLWGRVQASDNPDVIRLLISNGIVLFAVISVLTAQAWLATLALMLGYLGLVGYERGTESLPVWYLQMRYRLTAGVVLSHGLFFAIASYQGSA